MLSTIIWILLLAGLLINGYYKTVLAMFILPIFIIVYAFLNVASAIKDSATSSGGSQEVAHLSLGGSQEAADLSSVEATPLPAPSPVLSQPTCICVKNFKGKCIINNGKCKTPDGTLCSHCPACICLKNPNGKCKKKIILGKYKCITKNMAKCSQCPQTSGS
jgi:hypothetical protein